MSHHPAPFPELTAYLESYHVAPGLFAGSHPSRFQAEVIASRVVTTIISYGVTTFIDLTAPGECVAYTHLLPFGINYLNIPIPDFSVPDRPTVTAVLDSIDHIIRRGGGIYLHCHAGIGRTGTIVGCWLMRHQQEGRNVISTISQLRGDMIPSPETSAQRDFVQNWQHGA